MADEDNAPEEEEGGEDAEPKKKKLPGKMLVLFIAAPVLLLVLGGTAAFLLLGGGGDEEVAHAEDAAHAEASAEGYGDGHGTGGAHEVVFYELPDILVNIQAPSARPTYLKLTLTLEVDSEDVVHEIEPAMPRVMDRFQAFLRELRVEDLNGSAGSYRLRQELLRRVNLAVAPAQVRAVLIEEMLIQ